MDIDKQPPRKPRRGDEAVLATPDELRDRIRQLGRARPAKDDSRVLQVRRIVAAHQDEQGALLPVLHEVQDAFGHVPADLVPDIADGLNLSRAEVHGVVTFYHHFRSEPVGRRVMEICRAEACQAMGSETLWQQACQALALPPDGGTTHDGSWTLQPVYCLGLCAQSPALLLDGQPMARMGAARLDQLLVAREPEAA